MGLLNLPLDITRRFGKPRTNKERMLRHKAKYGTTKLPKRGTGLLQKTKLF